MKKLLLLTSLMLFASCDKIQDLVNGGSSKDETVATNFSLLQTKAPTDLYALQADSFTYNIQADYNKGERPFVIIEETVSQDTGESAFGDIKTQWYPLSQKNITNFLLNRDESSSVTFDIKSREWRTLLSDSGTDNGFISSGTLYKLQLNYTAKKKNSTVQLKVYGAILDNYDNILKKSEIKEYSFTIK